MNEKDISRHIKRLYILVGCLIVAFVVLAFLVWRKSPHEILRQELHDLSFQMAQQPIPIHEQEETKRIREETLESRIKEANTIILCKHDVQWGKVCCRVTEVLKHRGSQTIPASIGEPLARHERRIERDETSGEGMITFFNPSFSHPSSGLVIHDGKVTDSRGYPDRPVRKFTVKEVVQMIESANHTSEGIRQSADGQSKPTM